MIGIDGWEVASKLRRTGRNFRREWNAHKQEENENSDSRRREGKRESNIKRRYLNT